MIVIQPGGYHPFHAGHAALYQSALKAFPNADVYVAATNDTKTRPFPFEIKEKLAKLAGVMPGHFVQVKSPFQAKEITQNYDPEQDVLVFVRSEKDRDEQPKPGGTKKDGSPAYFQPYTGKNLQPFGKHGYIAYLPTVEFGPGIKSATEIRNIWPQLNDRRKLAMVMSLYPKTQDNLNLAQNVVKLLDIGMGNENISESSSMRINEFAKDDDPGREPRREQPITIYIHSIYHNKTITIVGEKLKRIPYGSYDQVHAEFTIPTSGKTRKMWLPVTDKKFPTGTLSDNAHIRRSEVNDNIVSDGTFEYWAYEPVSEGLNESGTVYSAKMANIVHDLGDGYFLGDDSYDDDEGFSKESYKLYHQDGPDQFRQVGPLKVSAYNPTQAEIEQEIDRLIQLDQPTLTEKDDKSGVEQAYYDPETHSILSYARQHYPEEPDLQAAFVKFVLRSLKHSKNDDERQDNEIELLLKRVNSLQDQVRDITDTKTVSSQKVDESIDYLDEK